MKRNTSITNRVLRYLIIIVVLSNTIVFCVHYYITRKNMTEQSIVASRDLMESNLTMMEQYFDDIDNLAASIIYNRDIIRFMKSEQDKASDLEFLRGVESLYYNSRPDLQLTFYKAGKYDQVYSILQENVEVPGEDYRRSRWYRILSGSDEPKEVIVNEEGNEKEFIHSIVYKVEDAYGDEIVGYLKIDMNLNSLKERFLHSYSQVAGNTITDEYGNILFCDKAVVRVPEEIYEQNTSGTYETDHYIMAYGISENTGWRLCIAMSKKDIFRNQNELIKTLLALLLLIVLCTVFISRKCFRIITENFKRLVRGMEEVKKGKLTTQVEDDTQDEISILIKEFNQMMQKVNMLVRQVESKQILLKEAEIKALQQQINPHFMHNIMETIMGLASEGMDEEVITMSKCMSYMLRYNTGMESITRLQEEIHQVKSYIRVLEIQYEGRFEVFYDIDDSCLEFKIVKFTLQPLVENAISHGLKETAEGGMLRIRVKDEKDSISIMIYDNGTGISADYLKKLNDRLKATSEQPLQYIEQYKSVGILNVHLRLKLFYGDAYTMEIFSKEGKGTCISLKLPLSWEREDKRELAEDTGGRYV